MAPALRALAALLAACALAAGVPVASAIAEEALAGLGLQAGDAPLPEEPPPVDQPLADQPPGAEEPPAPAEPPPPPDEPSPEAPPAAPEPLEPPAVADPVDPPSVDPPPVDPPPVDPPPVPPLDPAPDPPPVEPPPVDPPADPLPPPVEPCDRYAAPEGSDSATGSIQQPFRTAQRLVDDLRRGDVGCLRAGTYTGGVQFEAAGSAAQRIMLRSHPGERATIAGRVQVRESADFVSVVSLVLDGRSDTGLPSPAISGDDSAFVDNEVTSHDTAICFDLGPTTYGRAYRTLLSGNRIHGCGDLPATNLEHGVYVEHATGTTIVDNLIHDNADRGINLYPDAQESYIARNVIDGNGEGLLIGGGAEEYGPQASRGNVIEHNLITNSTQRYNVEAHWGADAIGDRNIVRRNCIHGGARSGHDHGLAPQVGFSAADNVMADPLYADPIGNDFSLAPGSPCAGLRAGPQALGGAVGAGAPGVPAAAQATAPGARRAARSSRPLRHWDRRPIIRERRHPRRRWRRARRRKETRPLARARRQARRDTIVCVGCHRLAR